MLTEYFTNNNPSSTNGAVEEELDCFIRKVFRRGVDFLGKYTSEDIQLVSFFSTVTFFIRGTVRKMWIYNAKHIFLTLPPF